MKKKRILIFSTSYSPFMGGAEIALREITDRLNGSDFCVVAKGAKGNPWLQPRVTLGAGLGEGFCFDMVTLQQDKTLPKFEKIGNINVYRISSPKLLFPFLAYFKALALHRKNKYDIVWSMMAGRNGFAALFFKFTHKKIKYLLTLQEGDQLSYPKERAGMLWFLVGGLFKKIFTKADLIQVISKYLEQWAKDMGYKGEIEVVPNGADLQKFQIPKHKLQTNSKTQITNKLKKELGIGENEKVIITTSRLVEKNAIEDIIRSLTFLPDNYKLLIAGSGELFYELRKLTDDLQLTKRVLFLGNIEHNELPRYLHISDVFVRPSLSEGLGSSFIEAMAASVPVIATKVGGITDFLKEGKTGLFCGIHDPRGISEKIELLIKDNALREGIIKNASKIVEDAYDWDFIAKKMKEKVFDKLEVNKNKSVLIATGIFPPDIGGPATYSKLLLDELPKHGFDVRALSFGEVRHLPKFIRHIVYFFKVLNRGRRTDIIFAQDPVSVGLPSAIASKILRKKFLIKIVGDYAWEQFQVQSAKQKTQNNNKNDFVALEEFQNNKYDFKTEIRRKIERLVAKSADKIIVPSKYLKKIVSMWSVDKNNINVVYNGLKNIENQGSKKVLRTLLKFEGKLIISVGRLVPLKRFDILIEIIPVLLKKFPDIKLMIVGSGPDGDRLNKLIQELDLKEHVGLSGALPQEILFKYIYASDLLVLNSIHETFPHQLLEAMSIGTPVVATSVGGIPEIIKNYKEGILITSGNEKELKNAIVKILSDKSLSLHLTKEAKKKADTFNLENVIFGTVNILSTI